MSVPILNPELHKKACYLYGDWFALDLLAQLWTEKPQRGEERQATGICPGCGTKVTVDWKQESVSFGDSES